MTAERNMNSRHILLTCAVAVACLLLTQGRGFAKIPEPDHIVYGAAADGVDVVSLKVNDQQVATYTVGSNPDADGYYILRIPMDALDPQLPGTARAGDTAYLHINGDPISPFPPIVLGDRGSVFEISLDPGDADLDGLPDDWEQQIIDADPNDGIASTDDVNPDDDFDGDGESNLVELNNGTDPTDPMSARRGDMNGDGFITLADAITALTIICGMDPESGQIISEADVNGDEKCGVHEVIFIMHRISGLR